ncbi:hypothetical protein AGRA3207_001208 [Actinomadura graeca]|uniref:Uncharacterized protein n=1 Tax=Actinomadura graeca TaxID=2750812 RepID=A0ABX8QNW6_9ACTN|nr:hypothetical protein [Actinomadura graeca]QXJ20485.1 hypothetical protein AGRA3207_001208 [Actinomadura graeca]
MQTFEDRLLAELKDVVAARTAPAPAASRVRAVRWRRAGLTAAAVVAAAAAAIVVPVMTGDRAPKANAVVRDPDGSIRLYIRDYRHPELIASRLRALGIPAVVDFVPDGERCRTPRGTIVPDDGTLVTIMRPEDDDGDGHFTRLHPDRLKPGRTLVLEVGFTRFGRDASAAWTFSGTATGPVAPCVPVPGPVKVTRLPDGGVGG